MFNKMKTAKLKFYHSWFTCALAITFSFQSVAMGQSQCSSVYEVSKKLTLKIDKSQVETKSQQIQLLLKTLKATRTLFNERTFEKELEFRLSYDLGDLYTIEFIYKADQRQTNEDVYRLTDAEIYLPNGTKSKGAEKMLSSDGQSLQIQSIDLPLPSEIKNLEIPIEIKGQALEFLKTWSPKLDYVDVHRARKFVEKEQMNRLIAFSRIQWVRANLQDTLRKQSFKVIIVAAAIWLYSNYENLFGQPKVSSLSTSFLTEEAYTAILTFINKVQKESKTLSSQNNQRPSVISTEFQNALNFAKQNKHLVKQSISALDFYGPLALLDNTERIYATRIQSSQHSILVAIDGALQIRWYPSQEKIVISHSKTFAELSIDQLNIEHGSHFLIDSRLLPQEYRLIAEYMSQK